MKISAVILAGGKGLRMGEDSPKQFFKLGEKPVIAWSIDVFNSMDEVSDIIVVAPEEHLDKIDSICSEFKFQKVQMIISGGDTRQGSSYNAISCEDFDQDDILVFHDAARPFVDEKIVANCISKAEEKGAAGVYVKAIDTIAKIESGFIKSIPPREDLYCTQTPQAFKYYIIKDAHKKALKKDIVNATDDVFLAIDAGYKVSKVDGNYSNIKITTPYDYNLARWMINSN